jgi:hypothetical protein
MTLSTIFYRYLGQTMVFIGPIWFFVLFIWGAWEFNFSLLLRTLLCTACSALTGILPARPTGDICERRYWAC